MTVNKVVYKPDSQQTDEFIVLVHSELYDKWSKGDRTIPLADVVDSFEVFHCATGTQGILGKASNQQLDNVFGTHKDVDVVTQILEKGQHLGGSEHISKSFHGGDKYNQQHHHVGGP
ncbi:hypothetical protein MCUN1_001976 [Malassezia cuniculi]|uniref:Ribosome maturation protein SDO1/SBDS N-terminal domain-containing protein n=1 Tax=Malassezia cuniculi TaxID=948313 RepID=A0AAF0J639_9BASI|nr:hypothetical protein MCUN1_001976 [Malassezia cuniculi]